MGNYFSDENQSDLSVNMTPEQYNQYNQYLQNTRQQIRNPNQSNNHNARDNHPRVNNYNARQNNQQQNHQQPNRNHRQNNQQHNHQQPNRNHQLNNQQHNHQRPNQNFQQNNQQQNHQQPNRNHQLNNQQQNHQQQRIQNSRQNNQQNSQYSDNLQYTKLNITDRDIMTNNDITIESIDPLDILSKEQINLNELLNKYKSLRRIYHPDRNPSGGEMFIKINQAVNNLLLIKNKNTKKNNFNELKHSFINTTENESAPQPVKFNCDKFTKKNFNKFFTENQFEDDKIESGYGYMMTERSNTREDINIERLNIKKNQFNNHFINKNQHVSEDIIEYREPEAPNQNNYTNYDKLGEKTTNFTSYNPQISFTDYKDAYDESKMINDQQYNIKTRKYEEYKTQRKSDSLKLTEEQERVINNNKLLQQQKSSQRINNMAQRRMKLSDYANNLNKLMLGPN